MPSLRQGLAPAALVRLKGKSVKVEGDLVVGRSDDPKVDVVVRGGRLEIYDPNKYISREHLEVKFMGGEPHVRDLGSVNGTAIYRGGEWVVISRGPKKPGDYYPLRNGDLIALAYSEEKGPYLVITVKMT